MAKNNPQESEVKQDSSEKELKGELSNIAIKSKKNSAIFVCSVLIFGLLLYKFILSPNTPTDSLNLGKTGPNVHAQKDNDQLSYTIPEIPKIPTLPDMPTITAPTLPAAKAEPTPPPVSTPSPINIAVKSNEQNPEDKKRKSSIMLINNPQPKPAITPEKAEQDIAFKRRSDLKYLLTKGKVIEIALETAINTDQPSEIIGIVSRDVFAEDGETRLIPKGSKTFGSFKSSVDDVYGIISIDWNRIDLATGYSLMLSATSVDNLGRSGIQGRLDNKYKEAVSSNLLSSAINIALAQAQDKLISPGLNTSQSTSNQLLIQQLNTAVGNGRNINITTNIDATGKAAPASIQAYCQNTAELFKDKTMPAYNTLLAACGSITTQDLDNSYSTYLANVISAISTAAASVSSTNVQNSTTNFTPTQTAVQSAVKDFGGVVKDILTSKKYKPNITVNQGELIRIYVNKDYVFPKDSVDKLNVIQ